MLELTYLAFSANLPYLVEIMIESWVFKLMFCSWLFSFVYHPCKVKNPHLKILKSNLRTIQLQFLYIIWLPFVNAFISFCMSTCFIQRTINYFLPVIFSSASLLLLHFLPKTVKKVVNMFFYLTRHSSRNSHYKATYLRNILLVIYGRNSLVWKDKIDILIEVENKSFIMLHLYRN